MVDLIKIQQDTLKIPYVILQYISLFLINDKINDQ